MTKIAICYFSYWKDIDFLNCSLKCLYKTLEKYKDTYEVKVYVFDDGRCEKQIKKKELIGNPTLIKTMFDRKGNLNGYECIEGMFKEYENIQKKFDYDYLIKLDSDCVLNSLDYIRVAEEGLKKANISKNNLALMGTYFASVCVVGCCQTFGKIGITAINNLFNNMNKSESIGFDILKKRVTLGYNEDKVVSVLLEMSPFVKLNIDTLPNIKGNCNAFMMPDDTNYNEYTSVAFKPNYFTTNYKWTRESSLDNMKKYVNSYV
jgi:hypothetical protein